MSGARATVHLALVGPTASGKSALALAAARALGDVEIVSADALQVYRGMDVGTAKPTPDERREVRHHLLDLAEPCEEWSLVRHRGEAHAALDAIEARGHRALIVGGTGLYVRAVVDDLRAPPTDAELRAGLEARADEPGGLAALHEELARIDPVAASRIEPGNRRRVVRALEVVRLTGRRFSSFGAGLEAYAAPARPVRLAGVWLPRLHLAARIAARVEAMRAAGLLEEVRALASAPAGVSRTAAQAIGYRELLAHLEPGRGVCGRGAGPGLEAAFEQIVVRTRALARRQRVWFRRDPRITWFGTARNPCGLLDPLLAWWSR